MFVAVHIIVLRFEVLVSSTPPEYLTSRYSHRNGSDPSSAVQFMHTESLEYRIVAFYAPLGRCMRGELAHSAVGMVRRLY